MSPRSSELIARAREGVAAAKTLVDAGHAAAAVSTAYYAMLYAARAALSEHDRSARTHAGTWAAFRDEFVVTGEFDEQLARDAQRAQARREASDYAAESFELFEARQVVASAERFVEAVDRRLERRSTGDR